MVVLPPAQWQAAEAAHVARVDRLLAGHRERAGRGKKHPVEDFLFSYYALRPGRLRRWHPGIGTALSGEAALERLEWRDYTTHDTTVGVGAAMIGTVGTDPTRGRQIRAEVDDHGRESDHRRESVVGVDVARLLARRGDALRAVRDLLAATAERPAQFGCFGLHEWAMVYRLGAADVRHAGWPLRLGGRGTDAVVEGHRIRCTHHDAFRFFTDAARPRNELQPRREDQIALDQPGCLHVTMDLYKWSYTLLPATPSELVVDCLELARDVRTLDMRASPYDLRALGYPPLPIETPAGRAAYAAAQRAFAERAVPLRTALLEVCDRLFGGCSTVRAPATSLRMQSQPARATGSGRGVGADQDREHRAVDRSWHGRSSYEG
jgi:hypothetical protein